MSHFGELTQEIDKMTELHKKSRVARFLLWVEYRRRKWENKPFPFSWVKYEGTPVGDPMEVHHLSLHDMMEHEVRGQLTAEVLLKGRRINAFSCEGYQQVERMVGKTTIQPRWVEAA